MNIHRDASCDSRLVQAKDEPPWQHFRRFVSLQRSVHLLNIHKNASCDSGVVQAKYEPPWLSWQQVPLDKWKVVLDKLDRLLIQVEALESVLEGAPPSPQTPFSNPCWCSW